MVHHLKSPVFLFTFALVAMYRASVIFLARLDSPLDSTSADSHLGRCPFSSMWLTRALDVRWCLTSALCSFNLHFKPR